MGEGGPCEATGDVVEFVDREADGLEGGERGSGRIVLDVDVGDWERPAAAQLPRDEAAEVRRYRDLPIERDLAEGPPCGVVDGDARYLLLRRQACSGRCM